MGNLLLIGEEGGGGVGEGNGNLARKEMKGRKGKKTKFRTYGPGIAEKRKEKKNGSR